MWDYPAELRLVGEHIAPRVGHRVHPSKYLKEYWARLNFTDYEDGWDHQSDRLGSITRITDDGRLCEVQWDRLAGKDGSCDWCPSSLSPKHPCPPPLPPVSFVSSSPPRREH